MDPTINDSEKNDSESPSVNPPRKKLKIKRSPIGKSQSKSKNFIQVFQGGDDERFLIGVVLHANGYGGYTKPILTAIQNYDLEKYPKLGEDYFDMKCQVPIRLRKSHDEDLSIPINPRTQFGRLAFVSYPNDAKYPKIDFETKREFRDLLVEMYSCREDNKDASKIFDPFQSHHCDYPDNVAPNSPLDHIFLDSDVHVLANVYHIPDDYGQGTKYDYMKSHNFNDIYTRHANGKYSYYAQMNLGYPNDVVYEHSLTQTE